MVKLRKYFLFFINYLTAFSVFLLLSCGGNKHYVSKIEGNQIAITNQYSNSKPIDDFIKPYKEHLNKTLDTILSYCPETLDKSKGEWQSSLGNLMADMTIEMGNPVFRLRENKEIDICILNYGGMRSIMPKGNITIRTAFEIMPFDNLLFVNELKGTEIREMANYLLKEKKAHPLSGLKIIVDKNTMSIKSLLVRGIPVNDSETYFVATSDYLTNGGDNMIFFKKAIKTHDMNYKIRNIMIDYFKKTDTIPVITNKRIILE